MAAVLIMGVVGCGGALADETIDPGDVSPDGSSHSAPGHAGHASPGEPEKPVVTTCTIEAFKGTRACVPGVAPEGVPIVLEMDTPDYCAGCFDEFGPCDVDVSGDTITLSMTQKRCTSSGECPPVCVTPKVACKVPPLAAGQYTVKTEGEVASPGRPPRTLVVAGDSALASPQCELGSPFSTPAPVDSTKLSRSCSTDADCTLTVDGSVCQPCACPNLAVSTTTPAGAFDEYLAQLRSTRSQCLPGDDDVACAGCANVRATCVTDGTSLTGMCTLTPGF